MKATHMQAPASMLFERLGANQLQDASEHTQGIEGAVRQEARTRGLRFGALDLSPIYKYNDAPASLTCNTIRQWPLQWLKEKEAHVNRDPGVEVIYTSARPRKNVKLVIAVRGLEPVQHKIAKTGPITWNGNILCPTSSSLTIDVREKRMPFLWKRRAHIEVADIDTSSMSLPCAEGVTIDLTFSGFDETEATEAERRKEDAKAAREKVEAEPVILEKMGRVRGLIGLIKPVGEAVGDIHPAIKGAFIAVGLLIQACEKQEACKEAALALTKEWDEFLSLSSRVDALNERVESREAVKHILELIDTMSNFIVNHKSTGVLVGLLPHQYEKKIEDFRQEFAEAMDSFKLSLQIEALKGINDLENNQMLEVLKPAMNAHYKPGEEHMCLKGTRTSLLRKAKGRLRPAETAPSPSAAQPRVFWVYGMGGSGKSYVANTVAADVSADADLDLSCFFCKRDDPDLSKPERFFPTLAYRIAQHYASYRTALVALLRSPDGAAVATGSARTHFNMLFRDLLPKIEAPSRSHVIVVDALDECGTPADQGELAECILSLAKAAPWIKVFVTSRPVNEVRERFSTNSLCEAADIKGEADTDADIQRFIEAEVERVRAEQKTMISLSSKEIDQLVRQTAGLFIWASTLFKYVRTSRNPRRELQTFLSKGVSKEPLEQLYGLYDQVLESAVDAAHRTDVKVLHAVLGIVFISAGNRPLSAEALSCFLRVDEQFKYEDGTSVRNMTRALHAVLYEDAGALGAVRVHHPSFLDFVESKLKDGFSLGIQDTHRLMFKGCLAVMNAELKFNICDLEDSTLLNKDVPGLNDRISTSISETLHYSSLFWFPHLSESGLKHDSEASKPASELLCSRKFLFWLEVLSLLGAVGRGAAILRGCAQFFEGSPDIADIASDLEKFVLSSSEAMHSAPHIYLSALTWVPEETLTQRNIVSVFQNVHWITRKGTNWEATRWVKGVGEGVSIVTCSPDGRFVAARVSDFTVRILDSRTGEPVGEPLRYVGLIKSLSFSVDGERVMIFSYDAVVTTWNVKTGAIVEGNPFRRTRDLASRLAISPDGSLVAGTSQYTDTVVGVWDAQTGAAVGEPLVGHAGSISSIAFSPDGQHLVSGSEDKTIYIWNVNARKAVGNPLQGHEDRIYSVSYSPDGRFIASCSSDIVRIWSAQTGAALQVLSGGVTSLSFSPDGQRVALVPFGSADATIRIRDTMTGMAVGVPLQGHSGSVNTVAFSPDGRHIVSGSEDETVRMWDVGFGAAAGDASEGHSEPVSSISFSPDGERIASGSYDGTVRIWDTKTGAAVGGPPEGRQGQVSSVCFSPDGSFVASTSYDKTIRLWNAATGVAVGEPLVGHTHLVSSIAFSPDGQHVVSGSWDGTIRIWDVETGTAVGNPFQGGHEERVTSVSYSPDGQCIVSGSTNSTVRIWNAETGAALLKPLQGHSNAVAFSQDGRWIASGSEDETVRIWDANTGATIGGPLDCGSPVFSVAISPDSRRIVSGSGNGIRTWDVETRTEIAEPICSLENVYAVAFSPDGQHFASGSLDQSVRIWDARTAPVRDGGPSTGAHWKSCCARMHIRDGWVKDGEKLLLWIPHRYRENFIYWRNEICIRRGAPWPITPEVDLEKLFAYTGTGWTQIYEE